MTVSWRHNACSSLLGTRERFTCRMRVPYMWLKKRVWERVKERFVNRAPVTYYSVYTKKGKEFVLSRSHVTRQGSTPTSLVLLPVLFVLLRTRFVKSRPSCLAWKGEGLGIRKTQTYTLLCISGRMCRYPCSGRNYYFFGITTFGECSFGKYTHLI